MPKAPRGWHKEDIKAAIRKRGVSLERLSLDNGLHRKACTMALFRPHFAAEMAIAEFLGVSPRQIWPQRYDADGTYHHSRSRNNYTRRGGGGERQKGQPE